MPGQGRRTDNAQVPADSHGCVSCPHPCIGPATSGSEDVITNGQPSLRVGDEGIHSACCGKNGWNAKSGSGTVFINNKAAHRLGDQVQHCGGMGQLVTASTNVMVGG